MNFFWNYTRKKILRKRVKNYTSANRDSANRFTTWKKELGISLFDRNVKGVTPTEDAERLHPLFASIQKDVSRLKREVDDIHHSYQGELNIVCAIGAMYYIPMDFLIDFQKSYPEIKLSYEEATETAADQMLLNEGYDIGFLAGPIDNRYFHSTRVFSKKVCAYVPKNHPFAEKTQLNMSDLDGQDLLFYPKSHKSRIEFDNYCKEHNIKPNIVFETANSINMIPLLRANRGITLSIPLTFDKYCDDDIVEIPMEGWDTWDLYLAWKKDSVLSPQAKIFMQYIENYEHNKRQ